MPCEHACPQCPWRKSNHGKRHSGGFYTKANLQRLWNQIRRGGGAQSCHLTDPSHPDHIKAGASPNAKAKECPGSVVLIYREFAKMADAEGNITDATLATYRKTRKRGLTRDGIIYWLVSRFQMGGVPFVGGSKLPEVDPDDAEIGLPAELAEG